MPANIEVKARLADPDRTRALATSIAGVPVAVLQQCDTFFPCASGRLKLRELSAGAGELIAYSRPDTAGSKRSDYCVFRTDDPASLGVVLAAALGTRQIVSKTRTLFLMDQTRIHLDEVAGLGWFLELEVVLREGQTDEEGHRIARGLMQALEVGADDLIEVAYADMLPTPGEAVPAR